MYLVKLDLLFSELKHIYVSLSVKYNHITRYQHELQSITYFPYPSLSSVEMTDEYNNLLQCKRL